MSDSEQVRNLALVEELSRIWEIPSSAEAMLPYFAEDCAVRLMESLPFAIGHDALVQQVRSLMPLGTEHMRIKPISMHATGPMVVTHRLDTFVVPGKPDVDFEMFGVFHIVDGKIKEWTDFMLTPYSVAEDGTVSVS